MLEFVNLMIFDKVNLASGLNFENMLSSTYFLETTAHYECLKGQGVLFYFRFLFQLI